MASERQIAANRRNAEKSTGPRTDEGKKRASRNSLQHGLRAEELLTPDECPVDYEAFRGGGLKDLKPVGFLEAELAESIIKTYWRKRRCARIEAGLLGGGKHVMEEIEVTDIRKFAKGLEHNVSLQDCTFSQLLYRVMLMRIEAHYMERSAEVPPFSHGSDEDQFQRSLKKGEEWRRVHFSGKAERHKTFTEGVPFSEVSNEDLVREYLKAREEEHQKNPLSYDIALAFKRDSSGEDALTKLARYEAALDRSLHRNLREFQRLQAERKKEEDGHGEIIDVTDLNRPQS
jgi:hypothetical protein